MNYLEKEFILITSELLLLIAVIYISISVCCILFLTMILFYVIDNSHVCPFQSNVYLEEDLIHQAPEPEV